MALLVRREHFSLFGTRVGPSHNIVVAVVGLAGAHRFFVVIAITISSFIIVVFITITSISTIIVIVLIDISRGVARVEAGPFLFRGIAVPPLVVFGAPSLRIPVFLSYALMLLYGALKAGRAVVFGVGSAKCFAEFGG